jgi:hypothetical protein
VGRQRAATNPLHPPSPRAPHPALTVTLPATLACRGSGCSGLAGVIGLEASLPPDAEPEPEPEDEGDARRTWTTCV